MKVLVAFASKHGATREIAEKISLALENGGLDSDVTEAGPDVRVDGYDAVILGSAVYAGHWLKDAKRFVEANQAGLIERPVWIFSSGPLGDPPEPEEDPVDVSEIDERVLPVGHRIFAGKLDRDELGFGERAIIRALGVADGDFRDWQDIRDWAAGIVGHLSQRQPTGDRWEIPS